MRAWARACLDALFSWVHEMCAVLASRQRAPFARLCTAVMV
jgi:hypothetical protein